MVKSVLHFGNKNKSDTKMTEGNSFITIPELGGLSMFIYSDAPGFSSWKRRRLAFELLGERRVVTEAAKLKALL